MWRFAPDLPPDTPEVWQTCDGFHGDANGVYKTGWLYSASNAVTSGSDFTCGKWLYSASGVAERVAVASGSFSPYVASQIFAGTGAMTDLTGASTARPFYSAGIAAYGDIALLSTASSGKISYHTISGGANFADLAASVGADILLVNPLNIVIALRTNTSGAGWATSDVGDYTNWTTLEAASGSLWQSPGNITAGVILGNDVIAFKGRGVYRGTYVGGVIKWQWQLLHAEFGAWAPDCAVVAEDRVYFIGDQGFMMFDGAQFQKIDSGIAFTLMSYLATKQVVVAQDYLYAKLVYDAPNGLIFFFRQSALWAGAGSGGRMAPNEGDFYTYNIHSGAWGYQSKIQDNSTDKHSAIIDGYRPRLISSGGLWSPQTSIEVWNDTDNEFAVLSADFSAAGLTTYQPTIGTGKIGQRTNHTSVTRVIPRWTYSGGKGSNLSTATLKTCKAYAYNSILQVKGDVTATSVTLGGNQYWADYLKDAQYHQFDFLVNAPACIDGVEIETAPASKY